MTADRRPEHHEREKHRRYPSQGPHGERLHPFTFSPIVFHALGRIGRESYTAIQRLAKSAPPTKRGEISPGEIVQAAALKVVRMSALLKREALHGQGLGAVAKRPGDPGIGPEEEVEAESSGDSEAVGIYPVSPAPDSPRASRPDDQTDAFLFSPFSCNRDQHFENRSTALGPAYTPPGSSLNLLAGDSPEVSEEGSSKVASGLLMSRAVEEQALSQSDLAVGFSIATSPGLVAAFRTSSFNLPTSALTWNRLPGVDGVWIAENGAVDSSSGQLRRVPKGAGKSVRGPRDLKRDY